MVVVWVVMAPALSVQVSVTVTPAMPGWPAGSGWPSVSSKTVPLIRGGQLLAEVVAGRGVAGLDGHR